MIKQPIVSHFFDFHSYPENRWDVLFEEFAECGATHITLNSIIAAQLMVRPELLNTVRQLGEKHHIQFLDAHGLWSSQTWDLNVDDPERRAYMFDQHKLCIRLLASLGVRNYTMHIGAMSCVQNRWFGHEDFFRGLALESLEILLPAAEKEGVTIAIENSFEPSNAPGELLYYLQRLKSPSLGVCFDVGHAVVMADDSIPRDRDENNDDNRIVSWHGKLKFQHDALGQLAPYIVTAHLHDNDGCRDKHQLIFDGVADWKKYIHGLRNCPRLISIQNEVTSGYASIARMCRAFDRLLTL